MRKILITIILYSLFGLLLGLIAYLIKPIKEYGIQLFWIAIGIGQLSGFILYLIESNIYKSRNFIFIMIGVGIFLVAVMFKINHWPYGTYMLFFSFLFILITYLIRFFLKKSKTFIDYSKILWILSAEVAFVFKISHWPYGVLITYISYAIFWLGLLYILYIEYKSFFIRKLQ